MNTKHNMVSMLFMAIIATQTMVGAEDQFDCINRTEATYRTFQKNIKCVLSKQPCMNEQKKQLIKKGAALIAIVLIWASIGIGGAWWISQGVTESEKINGPGKGNDSGHATGGSLSLLELLTSKKEELKPIPEVSKDSGEPSLLQLILAQIENLSHVEPRPPQ